MPSRENVYILLFPAEVRILNGPWEESKVERPGVVKEALATDARMEKVAEVGVELLCQKIMKVGMAADMEKASELLHINIILKSRIYKVRVTVGLHNCPWKIAYAILDR